MKTQSKKTTNQTRKAGPKMLNFQEIEKKWQKKWEEKKIFKATEGKKNKYYVLEMYPYPSASYLHMGHVRNYTIGDVYARFKRMLGFNVLYPMGYDSFGLPAEIAAKKEKIHPKKYTETSIKKIMEYQKSLGNSYDWARTLSSHDPEYYKWNQLFFLKLVEKGLAYRKKATVNWCSNCESVLANEEAEGGKCWRCGEEVSTKELEQWFYKITAYADRLLKDLDKIDWPEKIKTMQKNWIGKSQGTEILFEINGKKWPIFTTRPDTLFGVTFMVVSAKHPKLSELISKKQKPEVEKFLKKIKSQTPCVGVWETENKRQTNLQHKSRSLFSVSAKQEDPDLEKEGVFTGSYAINPLTKEKIPVYTGNFVIADYGSGMVMAVPAHDQRDFEFAQKYKIPIKIVIRPENEKIEAVTMDEAYVGSGKLINSQGFNGLFSEEAKEHITKALEFKKSGKKTIQYKIRDWLISRQRYWGTPIPIIYCNKCGTVPVSEKELPVLLPEKVDFNSKTNPLLSNLAFVNTKCPKCNSPAKRETDTMGGFVDSSWYFLRFCDNKNKNKPFDEKKVSYWMPVDQYIGGAEHAVMHLIYARFFVKALKDLGFIKIDEPFKKLFNQGVVYKDGAKMSKSKGNVVFQTDISNKYGIDTARLFLMFVAAPDKQMEWADQGVEGAFRAINKLIRLKEKIIKRSNEKQDSKINLAIKKITSSIENFDYPKAIISIFDCLDYFSDSISKQHYETLLKLLSPFCPHITEELWEKIGNKPFLSLADWPNLDESKINPAFEQAEQAQEKTLLDIKNILNIVKQKSKKEPKSIYLYVIPKELANYNPEQLSKKLALQVKVFANNDKNKYDPQNKAKKAAPNRPAIYVE